MKVVHSAAPMSPEQGGIYAAVRDLTQRLEVLGVKNDVRMPANLGAQAYIDSWSPVHALSRGRIVIPPFQWSPQFGNSVLESDAYILHTHGIWQHPSFVALKWKSRTGRPHLASIHGMLEPWAWQHHAWKKRPVWWLWEKRNLQSASLLHATSEQEAQAFRDRGLTAPIAIIPNGVGLPPISDLRPPTSGPKSALFLSRIHPKKGLPLLLEAWGKVRPKNWRLHIVGPDEGGHRAELERQAVVLGLTDAVRFSGPLVGDAKAQAFREADLFVLPTHSENFGIAVAEAMAHRLPVITTHGAPWELLETERCGWWVPVCVDGIAEALEDATRRSPEELAAMGARGRAVVAERFSWERIAADMIACYEWVLGCGPKPGCVVE